MADLNHAHEELDQLIATVEENLRNLVEEATAYSGAADEERTADRIAEQESELAALKQRRDALS